MAHHRPLPTILFRLVLLPTLILGSVSGLIPANASVPIISRVLSPLAAQPAIAQTASCGTGDPLVVPGTCTVTIDVHDFASGLALADYTFIVNVDNTKLPSDPLALDSESFSPIVRTGGNDRTTFTLPDGRYLVSARSLDHKLWGAYFTLPDDATSNALTVRVDLTEQSEARPLPLGRLTTYVFADNRWTNGAPDSEESSNLCGGDGDADNCGGTPMPGFRITLDEETDSPVTVDYFNDPLCGDGVCLSDADGFNTIDNLGPASYFIHVIPPDGPCNSNPASQWYQTTTIDGGLTLLAPVEEGSDGSGAPGEQLWEPIAGGNRTGYFFGFVCAPLDFENPGTGEIVGQARNWVEWAPYTFGTVNDPVEFPFIALTDAATDSTIYVGQGDAAGNFDIPGVPAGTYVISAWDEQLSYIMRFKPITVGENETVDANETGDDGEAGVGVSRWFGWLDGTVYKDVDGNGQYDPGIDTTLGNTDVDQRWRDGSIKAGTFTDPDGYYVYPTAEGGALGRWIIGEQGFARFSAFPGASVHDEHTGAVTPSCVTDVDLLGNPVAPALGCIPNSEGGGLLVNQLVLEGHRATVDWGKRDYAPGAPGQIVGITYFATTRNEFDAALQAHEDYEPAVPDVIVYLEDVNGLVLNKYVTDHWQQPKASQDNPLDPPGTFKQNCNPIRDFNGADISSQFNPDIGPECMEVPLTGIQTKEGKFDGGYAFASYCPDGYDLAADDGTCLGANPDQVDLVAGDYVVHAIMPTDPTDTRTCNPPNDGSGLKNLSGPFGSELGAQTGCLYRIVKEEDVNVDLGNQFAPQIPPPPCVGDDHVLDQSTLVMRSPFYGDPTAHAPLCDKKLVVLQIGQNANADFNMMTNFRTDPNGDGTSSATGDVAEPGRFVGQTFNDIYFETNPQSPWYGEPRPIGGIPVGIYARVDVAQGGGPGAPYFITGQEIGRDGISAPTVTYDANKWRLLTTTTTSLDGSFEVLLPSTETWNCPIPQGPCPGMYMITVDDPGFFDTFPGGPADHTNPDFNPNLLTATTPASSWPGLTNETLDLPLDPISGTTCDFSIGPDNLASTVPELLQVSTPWVNGAGSAAARRITILADFIGPRVNNGLSGGHVNLTDVRTGTVTNLIGSSIVSWTDSAATPNPADVDTIVIQVPAINTGNFRPGPKQLTIVGANSNGVFGSSSINGITIHVLGSNGTGVNAVAYTPPVKIVPPPPPAGGDPHALQNAIDAASPGDLLVLSAGTYNENVLVWKPLKLQGVGPGGIIGAHELLNRAPEDPRFHVIGSVIDGRFFAQNAATYDGAVNDNGPFAVDLFYPTILRGADITVVAQGVSDYGPDSTATPTTDMLAATTARIDGVGLQHGHGDGAGGIQLQAYINNMQLTNNILENNGGLFAGGIGLGQPYAHANTNNKVRMLNDRILGNGGIVRSGGIGIFYGSDNYEVARSILCSNYGVEYGSGISHWGLSPNSSIHDNLVYFNESFDSGAGLSLQSEVPIGADCSIATGSVPRCLGDGTGPVDVDRNLFYGNYSGDDGGGIFIANALAEPINIRNNMIVLNGAADLGGAILLDDASNVSIINNTIANNVTTASSENSCSGDPACAHGGGLTSEANEPLFQLTLPGGSPAFSNPVALFNNIFWQNEPMYLDQSGPAATLVSLALPPTDGFIDFEIHGTGNPGDTFTPRFSYLTNGMILAPDGTQALVPGGAVGPTPNGQGNIGSDGETDPAFVDPSNLTQLGLTVTGSRGDPQQAAVTITGGDPVEGLSGGDFAGNFHLQSNSPAIDRGVRCSNLTAPVPPAVPDPVLTPCTGGGIEAPIGVPSATNPGGGDYDREVRPQFQTLRTLTPWDLGADEAGPSTSDLSITKTDNQTTVAAGSTVTYTIVVHNAGPSGVTDATVVDNFSAQLTGVTWTCDDVSGACTEASGTGNINTTVTLFNGGTATFIVIGTVASNATGSLVNTATVTAPAGVIDPTPSNNSATDTDTILSPADLSITKTNGVITVTAGTLVTYRIVVTNIGPGAVTGAVVSDTFSTKFTGVTWSCTASGGSSCGTPASGNSGNINRAVNLLNGGTATFIASGTLTTTATSPLVNTATVTAPAGQTDPNLANNTASDSDPILALPALPALSVLDNFNRANATTLNNGTNWSQVIIGGNAAIRVNTNQALCTNVNILINCVLNGRAIWNNPTGGFGVRQGAAFTLTTATSGSGLILKASGGALPANFIRVQFNSGGTQVVVATTNTGGIAYTTRATFSQTFAPGDRLSAVAYESGTVLVYKTTAANVTTFVGGVAIPTTGTGAWTQGTGGGRIGMQLPNGARVDDFRGGTVP